MGLVGNLYWRVHGLKGALRNLAALQKGSTVIAREALKPEAKSILKSAKANLPAQRGIGRTGLLRKSLAAKVKTNRRAHTYAVIGPRRRFGQKTTPGTARPITPTKYAHLVEFGRKRVRVKKARVLSSGLEVFGTEVEAVRPRPFLRPAWDAARPGLAARVGKSVMAGIKKQATP